MHPHVHNSIISNKLCKQLKCLSTKIQIKNKWGVYIYIYTHTHTIEYYLAIKNKEMLTFEATQMNVEGIMPSETLTDTENKLMITRGQSGEREGGRSNKANVVRVTNYLV